MTSKHALRGGLAALAGIVLCTVSFSSVDAQQSKLRIVQTNSAGDNVHIIDAVSNKVVGEIKGIEAPHGLAVAPDGSRIYISEQADRTLVVVDGKTLQVTKRIPLSGNPNLVDISADGRRLYVAIALTYDDYSEFPQIKANPSGGVDVIDTASLEKVKTIPIRGGIHDLNITPDGKYVLAGSSRGARPPANLMNVIDVQTNEITWKLVLSPAPSPMAISSNSDGSTKWIFAQNGTLNGFAVLDFATQAKINEIKLPDIPADKQNKHGGPPIRRRCWSTAG
jgi:YVTN family beta-propeller protein